MSKTFYIYTHKIGSLFAKKLQEGLREKVKNKVLRTNKVIKIFGPNCFSVESNPLNKIKQLERFFDDYVPCPEFATNIEQLVGWGEQTVFARTLVSSTHGAGIVEFDIPGPIVNAPLYTKYIPKKTEYRVHVLNGEVIDIQEKKKRRGFEGKRNTRIRNHINGYVYCRDGITPPDGIADLAIAAVNALDYNYGAVDIIYNEKRNKCYVLEVNSKPGLFGTTLDKYVDAIINAYNLERK